MLQPNRPFRVFVNHILLLIGAISLVTTAHAAKRKRSIKTPPVVSAVGAFQAEMLRTHNDERLFQKREPLVWDAALAADAAKWASHLAARDMFEHAYSELRHNGQGENLWMGTRSAYRFAEMVSSWLVEAEQTKSGRFPNVSKTGNWTDVGHYVQIVWPETRKVGCALKSSVQDDFLVCRYWPGGNRIGDAFTILPRK